MADEINQWHFMKGGIEHFECPVRGDVTVFRLSVDGVAQRVEIETWRLEVAGNYRRVLDQMVRDIQARLR